MKQKLLLVTAFLIGFVSVAMEITSSRLLAPHYGTSIFIWSNIISVVLLCLAIGYYLGGKLADKRPEISLLADLCLGGGLLFFLIPKLAPYLVDLGNRLIYSSHPGNAGFFAASFVVSFFLFGVPLVFLGMTSPLLVKLYNLSDGRVGNSAGSIYSVSTAGSILGSVVPTFWGLPLLGTTRMIILLAALLFLMVLLAPARRRFIFLALGVAACLALYLLPNAASAVPGGKVLYEGESYYHHIRVIEDDKGVRYLVFNEGLSVESVYDKNKQLTGAFYDYYSLLPHQIANLKPKVLVLGLAGATIPRQYNGFFPSSEVDAVEIDPKVVKIAEDYFDLKEIKANVMIADGRDYLARTDKRYDIVIIDVFQNELYIPWTFATREFWELVSSRLAPKGIVAMNVHSVSPGTDLLSSMSNTVASVFPRAYLTNLSGTRGYSYMLSAGGESLRPLSQDRSVPDGLSGLAEVLNDKAEQVRFDPSKPVLTDDWAPVDSMLDHSVEYYRKQRVN